MNDKTFIYRLIFGLSILVILAYLDYKRNPQNPRRLKEYLFLFSVTGLAMVYGVVHDFITCWISREYYIIGKGIDSAAGGFNLQVVKLAMAATWTAGLIIGVSFLMANNPGKLNRQLPYKRLYGLLFIPLSISLLGAVAMGALFRVNSSFVARVTHLEGLLLVNPAAFMTVWGIHIGSYFGGLVGLIAAVAIIRASKRKA